VGRRSAGRAGGIESRNGQTTPGVEQPRQTACGIIFHVEGQALQGNLGPCRSPRPTLKHAAQKRAAVGCIAIKIGHRSTMQRHSQSQKARRRSATHRKCTGLGRKLAAISTYRLKSVRHHPRHRESRYRHAFQRVQLSASGQKDRG